MKKIMALLICVLLALTFMGNEALACDALPEGATDHTKSVLQLRREKEEAAALAAIKEQKAAEAAANGTAQTTSTVAVAAPAGILFIGDSRCVQMKEAVGGGGCSWICDNGKRYEWFRDTAIPRADAIVGKGTKVVICMGVNDPGDVYNYATLTNQKAAEWAARGAKTYYVSVNPVWENPYTTKEQVEVFNSTMPGQLSGVKWIDTYTYIQAAGCKIVDGLHYDTDTYVKIFNAIIGSL